jgi:hypothetical protein
VENPRVILFLRPLTGAFEDLAIEEIKSQYETYLFRGSSSNYEETKIWYDTRHYKTKYYE